MAEVTGPPAAGVADLYRDLALAARRAVTRHGPDLLVAGVLVVLYVVLRTLGIGGRPALVAWVVGLGLTILAAPRAGLLALVAIAPYTEPLLLTRDLGVKPILTFLLALSVVGRAAVASARRRSIGRPPAPIVATVALVAVTLAGVGHTALAFGGALARDAAIAWLGGVGALGVALVAAWWLARGDDRALLWVAVGTAIVAGVVSLADWLAPAVVRDGALTWLVRPTRFETRLTGVIPQPNGTAALLLLPVGVLGAAIVLGPSLRTRLAAGALMAPLLAALWFTYSRTPLVALFAFAVLLAWRIRRALGIGLLAVGLVAGAALAPAYLASRGATIGGSGVPQPGQPLIASDVQRLTAWAAAARMFADAPLVGHGFLSYRELHYPYGDPTLSAPHNEWLRLFAEEGLVGGLAGIAFVGSVLLGLGRARDWIGTGILGAFLAYVLAASFNNPFIYIQVSLVVATIVGVGLARAGPRRTGVGPDPATAPSA